MNLNIFTKKRLLHQTFDEYFTEIVSVNPIMTPQSKKKYFDDLKVLKKLTNRSQRLNEFKFAEIERVKALCMEKYKSTTANKYLQQLRRVMQWSLDMGYINILPLVRPIQKYEIEQIDEDVKALDYEQFLKLLRACDQHNTTNYNRYHAYSKLDDRYRKKIFWMVKLLGYTGMRVEELRRLKWADWNRKDGKLTIRSLNSKKLGRTITLIPQAQEVLLDIPHWHKEYISPYHGNSTTAFRNALSYIKQNYQLDFEFSPKIFRASFASWASQTTQFKNIQHLAVYLGHRDIKTLWKYYSNKKMLMAKANKCASDVDFGQANAEVEEFLENTGT